MYIHSYQIHNVLNVYRKQLSQKTVNGSPNQRPAAAQASDRINISAEGQRPKIMDNISSQIVDRITKFGPKSEFDKALAGQLSRLNDNNDPRPAGGDAPGTDFTYTTIDERNRRSTSTLEIENVSPFNRPIRPTSAGLVDMVRQPEDMSADDDEKDLLNG